MDLATADTPPELQGLYIPEGVLRGDDLIYCSMARREMTEIEASRLALHIDPRCLRCMRCLNTQNES